MKKVLSTLCCSLLLASAGYAYDFTGTAKTSSACCGVKVIKSKKADVGEPIIEGRYYDTPNGYIHTDESIKQSYLKFTNGIEEFKAVKNIDVYDRPLTLENGTSIIKQIPKGTTFKADAYTVYGWVHVQDEDYTGWVRGYLLSPQLSKIEKIR